MSNYEVIVKYVNSESNLYARENGPDSYTTGHSQERLLEDPSEKYANVMTSTSTYSSRVPNSTKVVSYECVSYSIQEGAFFLVSAEEGRDGFFIPLSVIQEVQIIDNRTDEQKNQEIAALQAQQGQH